MRSKLGVFVGIAVSLSVLSAEAQTPWTDNVSVSGDIRVRAQRELNTIAAGTTGTTDNLRPRLRGRLLVKGKVNDSWSGAMRLATTPSAGNNRAANVDMTDFGAQKSFNLQWLFLDYKAMDGLNMTLGKHGNPFWSAGGFLNNMVWNSEATVEGLTAKWAGDFSGLKPYATLGFYSMLERTNNGGSVAPSATVGPDINLLGAQLGVKYTFEPVDINFSVASYNYNNMKGLPTSTAGSSTAGNSVDGSNYKYEYKLLDFGLELGMDLGFAPIAIFANQVSNSDPSENNVGMLSGLRLGAMKDVGSWMVQVNHRDVRKDAVVSVLSDAAFLGGGSDVMGTDFTVGYQAFSRVALYLYGSIGRKGLSTTPYDYELYTLDVVGSF